MTPQPLPELPPGHEPRAALFWLRFHLARKLRGRAFRLWAGLVVLGLLFLRYGARLNPEPLAQLAVVTLVPLMALFFGTGVLREEIEDQTLTYGFTRPVGRPWLYAARVLAGTTPVAVIGVSAAAFCGMGVGPQTAGTWALAALLSTFAYSGLFALLGQLVKWPAWFGLAFLLFWDNLVALVPGFLGRLTVSIHVRGLTGLRPQDLAWDAFWQAPSALTSTLALAGIAVVSLWVGGQLVRRREYVLSR